MTQTALQPPKLLGPRLRSAFCLFVGLLHLFVAASGWSQEAALQAAQTVTAKEAPKPAPAKLDSFGDPLPAGVIARLGSTRYRVPQPIQAIVKLPKLNTLAIICTDDRMVRLCDPQSGAITDLCELSESLTAMPQRRMKIAVYSEPHDLLLVVRNNGIDAIDVTNRKIAWKQTLSVIQNGSLLVVSPDGEKWAWWERNKPLRLSRVKDGEKISDWAINEQYLMAGSFSPDSKRLVVSGQRNTGLKVWNLETDKEEPAPLAIKEMASSLAFAPKTKHFAVARNNQQVVLFDWETKAEVFSTNAVNTGIRFFDFSPDGERLLVCDHSSQLHVWDLAKKVQLPSISAANTNLALPEFLDNRQIYYAFGTSLVGRKLDTGEALIRADAGHRAAINHCAVTRDGKWIATCGLDAGMCLWNARTGQIVFSGRYGSPGYTAATFSGDDRQLFWRNSLQTVQALDLNKLIELKPGDDAKAAVPAAARELKSTSTYNAQNQLYCSADNSALISSSLAANLVTYQRWNLKAETNQAEATPLPFPQTTIAWDYTTDLQTAALVQTTNNQRNLLIAELATGRRIQNFPLFKPNVPEGMNSATAARFTAEDRVLMEVRGRGIALWEILSGKLIREIPVSAANGGGLIAATVSEDGRWIAWAEGVNQLVLWDAVENKQLAMLPAQPSRVKALKLFPGPQPYLLACYEDGIGLVWDLQAILPATETAPAELNEVDLQNLWQNLLSDDAALATKAVWELAEHPEQAAALCSRNLAPIEIDPQLQRRAAEITAELDSAQFQAREQAMRDAQELGEQAEPFFDEVYRTSKSAEVRSRLKMLLQDWRVQVSKLTPEETRALRAIWVLERSGTPEAKALLKTLSAGTSYARFTREALSALKRMQ